MRKHLIQNLIAFTSAVAMVGCLGGSPTNSGGGTGTDPNTGTGTDPNTGTGTGTGTDPNTGLPTGPEAPVEDPTLSARRIDYGAALRTAAIKLVGGLPTMDELSAVSDAASYAAQIDKYLVDPRFAKQMLSYFQDAFKMGGPAVTNGTMHPSFDTAPAFAAQLVVADRSMTELLTATNNTCPTLDTATGVFTDGACPTANGLTTVGVLTDPGVQSQFFGNMAFRRVRWVQETFACTKFPAEYSATPVAKGSGQYVSPWPFESITGASNDAAARIDFQDASAVVCANCHSTMNHLAPLFANFDDQGDFQTNIQVKTPVPNNPTTRLVDWLPAGEVLSWRFQKPVSNLTELGAAMVADPAIADCTVARAWNWAMSKTDIVNDAAVVPQSTIDQVKTIFVFNDQKLKPTLKAIFTSDDFVKF